MSIFSVGGSTPAADSAVESKSVRFDDASSTYFSRTPSVAGNTKTWSLSFWRKQDTGSNTEPVIACGSWSGGITTIYFNSGGALSVVDYSSSAFNVKVYTSAKYRDPSAWAHFVVVFDSTELTSTERVRIYKDGTRVTDIDSNGNTFPSQNFAGEINTAALHMIGRDGSSSSDYGRGYLAEMYFLDGIAVDNAADFGETDSSTNQWKPKTAEDIKAAVTFGVNGFYLPFSNDVLNTSFVDTGNGGRHTVTANGDVHTDTTIKKIGTASAQFDGTGDSLSVPDNSDFDFGAGEFNIECWAYFQGSSLSSGCDIITKYDDAGTNQRCWGIKYPAANNLEFRYSTNGSSWAAELTFSWTPSLNTWYHIAVSRDGVGNIRAFIDGTQIGSTQQVTATFYNSTALVVMGADMYNGSIHYGNALNGYMDEIRICNKAKYTSNFTAPTTALVSDSDTLLLLHCDGSDGGTSFPDSAQHAITPSGNAKNVRVLNNPVGYQVDTSGGSHIAGPKFGTGCGWFDASGDYLSVADSADWTFGTGDFTLEAWCNLDDNDENAIFSQYADASNRWYVTIDNRDNVQTIAMYHHASGLEIETNASSGAFGVHKWVHFAVVRASGVIAMYVDGVAQTLATNTSPSANMTDVAAALQVGAYNGGDTTKGYLDEVRVSNSARYTSNFTPGTTAFSNDGNTKLLLHCDGTHASTTFTDSSSGTHSVTATGNAKILVPKIGTGCYRNNGSGNGLMVPSANCPWAEFGSGDFTVEAWVSLDDISTNNQQFFTHRNSVNSGDWVFWWDASSGLQFSGSNDTLSQGGTTGWASNTWVHIAASRASGVNKIFVNGTLVATNSSATEDYNATATLFIASYSTGTGGFTGTSGAMTGFMDEARITPGKALYTSSFTPTTTAYTDDIDTRLLMHFDGGGPGTAGSDTNVGQGQYYHDSATNAIYYDSGLPKYKSYINFDGSGDYLSLPGVPSFDFGTGAFAIEFWFWVKDSNAHSALVNSDNYYVAGNNGNWAFDCYQEDVRFNVYNGTGAVGSVDSTGGKIECGVWNHVAFCRDGSGNSRIFINGVLSSSVSTVLNGEDIENGSTGVEIGGNISYAGPGDLNGGMDNIRISKSARYTSAFTKPTDRLTSDADTVFLLNSDFSDGGLGADHSGNYNYFEPSALGTEDMVEDSPTNNFATLNSLYKWSTSTDADRVYSEGNLRATTGATGWKTVSSSQAIESGKWYWETTCQGSYNWQLGLARTDLSTTSNVGLELTGSYCVYCSGAGTGGTFVNTTNTSNNNYIWAENDVIMCAYDDATGKFWLGKNGTWFTSGNPATGANADFTVIAADRGDMVPAFSYYASTDGMRFNFGADSSFQGTETAQGKQDGNSKGDFFYTPPTGFLALCTDNLDDPAIALPTDHFNTTLWTGNGTGTTRAITGVGFQPDLVWKKNRSYGSSHRLQDSVRGPSKTLWSNSTDAETNNSGDGYLASFDSDGFTLQVGSSGVSDWYDNRSGNNIVGWNWKAGGSAVSNSDGSITSSVSANTTAGFSIVGWTGTGSNATVGHGLSQAPDLIINKSRGDVYNWAIQSILFNSASDTNILYLNTTAAQADDTNVFQAAPTATVFSPQGGAWAGIGANTIQYIAYCFHSVDGYSKVGSYTGNGNADGPFVYTGFKPAMIIAKCAGSTSSWDIVDSVRDPDNGVTQRIYPNNSDAEETASPPVVDFLSNGFKVRTTSGNWNSGTSHTQLYIAFAESPFKTANAR